jgi:hypothetical protein
VAKGYTQREGIDYNETFSLVSCKDSFRIIMALMAHYDLELHQMDVNTAFLNGDLEETVYMHYTKAAQFRRPYIISSAKKRPTKITHLFRRPTKAVEIITCFRRPVQADENSLIFSSARSRPTKKNFYFRRPSPGRRKKIPIFVGLEQADENKISFRRPSGPTKINQP